MCVCLSHSPRFIPFHLLGERDNNRLITGQQSKRKTSYITDLKTGHSLSQYHPSFPASSHSSIIFSRNDIFHPMSSSSPSRTESWRVRDKTRWWTPLESWEAEHSMYPSRSDFAIKDVLTSLTDQENERQGRKIISRYSREEVYVCWLECGNFVVLRAFNSTPTFLFSPVYVLFEFVYDMSWHTPYFFLSLLLTWFSLLFLLCVEIHITQ